MNKQQLQQLKDIIDPSPPRSVPLKNYYEQDGMREKMAQSLNQNQTKKLPGDFAKGTTDFFDSILNQTGE